MKKYRYIRQSILNYYAGKDPDSIQDNKFKSQDWLDWCDLISQTKENPDIKLHNDSTSQNMCFTAVAFSKGIKTEKLITNNHFYVHKSMVGDFVTCYGVLYTNIIYDNEKIQHPNLIFVSPVGPFIGLFQSAWDLILKLYPDCRYVPYRSLKLALNEPEFQNKNIYSLLFGYEGDLKTNIYGDVGFTPE